MEDFVHSWTTEWCRVDSKVLEKINEVAKVLWGRIYFLIGVGRGGGGRFTGFSGSTRATESGQLNAESSHVIRLGARWSWPFAPTGRDDEEQKAWDQTVSVCVLAVPGQCPCSPSPEQSIHPQLGQVLCYTVISLPFSVIIRLCAVWRQCRFLFNHPSISKCSFLLLVSGSVLSNSFTTPWTITCQEIICPWGFPGRSTRVGYQCLLQGVSHPGIKSMSLALAGRFFTAEPPGKLKCSLEGTHSST